MKHRLGSETTPDWGRRRRALKRSFDLFAAAVGLALLWPVILVGWLVAQRSTGKGFFTQVRVGRYWAKFRVVKLRTMRIGSSGDAVTRAGDERLTPAGRVLRRYRLDELPQLLNVIRGDMSLVGPRPDVPGYADLLQGEEARLLSVRPGITGPATLLFRDEELLLGEADDPKRFNDEVIYPLKVRVNLAYLSVQSLPFDVLCVVATLVGLGRRYAVNRCLECAGIAHEDLPERLRASLSDRD